MVVRIISEFRVEFPPLPHTNVRLSPPDGRSEYLAEIMSVVSLVGSTAPNAGAEIATLLTPKRAAESPA
jgi:hypothetical protein